MMENVFLHLLNMSLSAAVLVVAVVLLRLAFFKAPRWIHCLLWALVAVRLLCPFTLESSLSLMPDTEAALSSVSEQFSAEQKDVPDAPENSPVIDTPVTDAPVVDTPVIDTPVIDTPVIDTPVVDTPVADTPVIDTPVATPTPEVSASTPTQEASVDPWQVAVGIATQIWLIGLAAMAVYAVLTTIRLRLQVREAARVAGNLWQCDHLRSPFILGVFRPRIYLPSDLSGTARDSVVAHEQAHLHRRDHWWKPLGFVLLTVYWFNPLMWVAYVLLCRDIEAACDERVVRDMTAPDRKAYSEALLACSAPRRLVSACPLAFGETGVKSRIKSVLSYKKPTVWIIVAALLISTVAGVCLLTDPKSEDGKPDTKVSTTPEEDDPPEDPAVAPTHAVFTHTGEPKAQVTLELNGNGCTYINSILSSAMPYEGTYVQSENGVTLSFPDDAMTIVFNGDFAGLTLRMGQSDTRMSYEQMSYGDKELKNGAVFQRQTDNQTVSFSTPHTISSMNWMSQEKRTAMREQYSYRTGNNSNNDRPIIPITSRAELDAFVAEYGIEMTFPSLVYDDAFFVDKMLVAVYYTDDSCSVNPQIAAVEYNGAELVTLQVDVYEPYMQEQALGQWFMLAEVPLDEIPHATAYRAVIRDRIPTNHYWATYSHPVTVGDEGDVGIGRYSIFQYGRETLMPLVEGLEWYGADIMADTVFTAIGHFSFDGEKKYYVSPDRKQLYDGEQIADLTVEESEKLDSYLRAGNPGEDVATASVTGTVTEWSKEGGYLVLEVTEGDSKLGSRVMVYTGILPPGSGPAVGYSATIYYDGWYEQGEDYSVIYAIHRKWMDADLLGGPDEPDEPDEPTTTTPPTTSTTPPTSSTTTTQPTTPTTPPANPDVTKTATVVFNCTRQNNLNDRQTEKLFGASSVVSIDSFDALKSFNQAYGSLSVGLHPDVYDAAFFEEYALLLTYHETASGSVRPQAAIYTYSADGTVLSVGVDELWPNDGLVTDDIGDWIILSVIQQSDLKGVTKLTSNLRAKRPQNSISYLVNPASDPKNSAEKWSKAITNFEGDVLYDVLISTMADEEWRRYTFPSDVLFDVKLVLHGDTFYYDIDKGIVIATDGRTVYQMDFTIGFWRLPARTSMIEWVVARYSETNDEVWLWEDFEAQYYSNDARLLNTPEMRGIALRTNWTENRSRNRTYDAQYTIGGALYYIDMEHEEVLTADEKQVSSLTKEEVNYLRAVLDTDE